MTAGKASRRLLRRRCFSDALHRLRGHPSGPQGCCASRCTLRDGLRPPLDLGDPAAGGKQERRPGTAPSRAAQPHPRR
jgi:hypothetical protein